MAAATALARASSEAGKAGFGTASDYDDSGYQEFCEELLALLPQIGRIARSCSANRADADDLVQLTCEKALTRWYQWSGKAPLKHWVVKILINTSNDQLRSPWNRMQQLDTIADLDDVCASDQDRSPHDNGLYMQQVVSAIQQLPSPQRDVVQLVALEELSYEETAATLRVPIGTVMSRLARARETLRQNYPGSP